MPKPSNSQSNGRTRVARGKRSVTADLRTPDGGAFLKQLVAEADVVIENYPAEVLV